jgi:hypothetical protein
MPNARPVPAPARLADLLDWLSADDWKSDSDWSAQKVQRRLDQFIRSFDGSVASGHVLAEVLPPPPKRQKVSPTEIGEFHWSKFGGKIEGTARPPLPEGLEDIDEIEVLHTALIDILQRGFPHAEPFLPEMVDLDLQFGIERSAPHDLKGRDRKKWEKRPGAYVMRVAGDRLPLVIWLVIYLLTLPGVVRLKRCSAPRAYARDERCGRWFVPDSRPGRLPDYCSDTCRQRAFWMRDALERKGSALQMRRERRRTTRKRRIK